MIDFDKIISSVLSEGISAEDITAKFNEAMAKAKEKVKQAKKPATRDDVIKGVEKTFMEHVEAKKLNLADASALLWLCAVRDTEAGKKITDVKELADLMGFINEDMGSLMEKWEVHRVVEPILLGNKRKKEEGETAGRSRGERKTDRDVIRQFLEDIFF